MTKASMETIEKYQEVLRKDPFSKLFAALVEAYREMGLLAQAEKIAALGVQRHPQFVSGLVAYSRVLLDLEKYKEALPLLKKATLLDTENVLAWQLLGHVYVRLSQPKDALHAFKVILLINPSSDIAARAIQKLEILSSSEYEKDLFEYNHIGRQNDFKATNQDTDTFNIINEKRFLRELSFVDALIVRNDLKTAKLLLKETQIRHPDHPEILKRWSLIEENLPIEEATELSPLKDREEIIRRRKIEVLENLLHIVKKHS